MSFPAPQSSDVEAIIDFDASIADLSPFIAAAGELVTELCESTGYYTPTRLTIIQTWLAAHFLAIRDPRYISERIGAAGVQSFPAQPGLNLSLTPYGQQARMLDTKGGLAWIDAHIAQGKRPVASVTWIGSRCNDRFYDYPWRFFGLYEV